MERGNLNLLWVYLINVSDKIFVFTDDMSVFLEETIIQIDPSINIRMQIY